MLVNAVSTIQKHLHHNAVLGAISLSKAGTLRGDALGRVNYGSFPKPASPNPNPNRFIGFLPNDCPFYSWSILIEK